MKKFNDSSLCYETKTNKKKTIEPDLSKINLIILYLNRNLNHKTPLP